MNAFRRFLGFDPEANGRREPGGTNRRQATRHDSGAEVVLGWWAEKEFQQAEGVLIDVSEGGAAAFVRKVVPPKDGTLFLRHSHAPDDAWIEVEIRSTSRSRRREAIVHVRFSKGCSYRFFRDSMPGTKM